MKKTGPEYIVSAEKRQFDIACALTVGAAMLPAGIAAAAGVCVDTRNINPFFMQRRAGRYGRPIDVLKLRTIREDNGQGTEEDKVYGTFDPRASKFGRFIRQTGLDELPQVVNVLRGDMSMVGPRPLLHDDLDNFRATDASLFDEWYEIYQLGPGIVSTSSVYRHGVVEMTPEVRRRSMVMDLDDAENASIENDIKLLSRTPFKLMSANARTIGAVANS